MDIDTCIFPNSGPHFENRGPLHVNFSKFWTSFWKLGTFTREFLKILDIILKIMDLYAWIIKKSGPHFENRGLLHGNFSKFWTSFWKLGTFTREFLKNLDIILKMMDLYAWIIKKSGPNFENRGPLRMQFSKFWTSFWKLWTFTCQFCTILDLILNIVNIYMWIFFFKILHSWQWGPSPPFNFTPTPLKL